MFENVRKDRGVDSLAIVAAVFVAAVAGLGLMWKVYAAGAPSGARCALVCQTVAQSGAVTCTPKAC